MTTSISGFVFVYSMCVCVRVHVLMVWTASGLVPLRARGSPLLIPALPD